MKNDNINTSPYGEYCLIPINFNQQFQVIEENSDDPVRLRLAAHIYYYITNCLYELDELCDASFNTLENKLNDDHAYDELASLVEQTNIMVRRVDMFNKVYVQSDEMSLINTIKDSPEDIVRDPDNVITRCFYILGCMERLLLNFGFKHPDVYFALEAVVGYRESENE